MTNSSVRKIYNAYSSVYDFLFRHMFYPRQSYAIKSMDIQPNEKVLDVGVGTGMALPCYPQNCEVTAIDLSESMLKKARKKVRKHKLGNVSLHEMDACNLEFEDDTFDHVVATFVISVVPDPLRALSEMKRVCKGGRPIILLNHFMSDHKVLAKAEEIIDPICKRLGWRTTVPMGELMDKAQLQIESCIRMKKYDPWSIVFTSNTK